MDKMKKVILFLLFSSSLYAGNSFAASFDCSKAKSFAEKTICVDPTLSKRDDELKEIYDKAKSIYKNKNEFSDLTRGLWNERERCTIYGCVSRWYDNAFVVYNSIISNGVNGSVNKSIDDNGVTVVNPKPTYQLNNESKFVNLIKKAMSDSENAKNDMQVGGIKSIRDKGICNAIS